MNVNYKGQEIIASNQSEMVVKLRFEYRLTYAEIGQLIGITRSRVGQILTDLNLNGTLLYPELENYQTFEAPDNVLAMRFNVPISRIASARKKLSKRRQFSIKVHDRRRHLCKCLFNNGYVPGPGFNDFIKEQVSGMSDKKQNLIVDFYIKAETESPAKKMSIDSNRVYRSAVKRELKERLSFFNPQTLVKEGIIQHGRSHS